MRPPSHVTGDIGQTAVSLVFKRWGWTADLIASDYGEDLGCHVFVDQQRTPFYFRCQVKSSGNVDASVATSGDAFAISIASTTCRDWLLAFYPVFIALHDVPSGQTYWTDATVDLRGRPEALTNDTVTFKLERTSSLEKDRATFEASITKYYRQLYRADPKTLERHVIPVRMPGSRVLDRKSFWDLSSQIASASLDSLDRDVLPTWTTLLRTLEAGPIGAMRVKRAAEDLSSFFDDLATELGQTMPELNEGEWLSFVCGPTRFSLEQGSPATLAGELTGWTTVAQLPKAGIVSEPEFCFDPPSGWIRQIGRRARSWDGFHSVSKELDVAALIHGSVPPTPTQRLQHANLRDHIRGQYIAWECDGEQLEELLAQLDGTELAFSELALPNSDSTTDGKVSGAVHTLMFNPNLGLYPMALTWEELERGTVVSKLHAAGLAGRLCGKEGSGALRERLDAFTAPAFPEPPEHWFADAANFTSGVPIDLAHRWIVIRRYQASASFSDEDAKSKLDILCAQMLEGHLDAGCEADAVRLDSFGRELAMIEVSWEPKLECSSADSIEEVVPVLLPIFDSILPRGSAKEQNRNSTFEILQLEGEIYFEGDEDYIYGRGRGAGGASS